MGHLSAIVATVAVAPATAAWTLRRRAPAPVTACLTHIAVVGFCVAICASDPFCHSTTFMLGKKADGTIASWAKVAFWPYHVGLRSKLWVQRRYTTEDHFNLISDGWYLGGWPSRAGLLPPGDLAILDCTCELPFKWDLPYLVLPIWDTKAPTVAQIETGVQWAARQRGAGRTVFVHCAHGHGRSPVLMCAGLLSEGLAENPKHAEQLVAAQRPGIHINSSQFAALSSWWKYQRARSQYQQDRQENNNL